MVDIFAETVVSSWELPVVDVEVASWVLWQASRGYKNNVNLIVQQKSKTHPSPN
jgi:hypothetical protein